MLAKNYAQIKFFDRNKFSKDLNAFNGVVEVILYYK